MMMKSSSSTATTTSLLGGGGGGGGGGGVRKGAWSHEEDLLLRKCIEKYGERKWGEVPLKAGLNRCRKSCRLRWLNYLHPNIKRGEFTSDEVDLIVRMHKLIGNRWTLIAGRIPGRTANDIKNYCNTHLKEMVLSRHHHHEVHDNKDHDQLLKTAADHDHGNKIRTIKPEAIKVLNSLPRTFSTRKELFHKQQQQPFEGGHGEFIGINSNSSNKNRVSTNYTSLTAAAAAAAATHSDAAANEKGELLNSFWGDDEGAMELMKNINVEHCDLHLDDNLWRLLDVERELM